MNRAIRTSIFWFLAVAGPWSALAATPGSDLKSVLLQPEFLVQQREVLKLSDEQCRQLRELIETMTEELRVTETELAERLAELRNTMAELSQSNQQLTRQFDALLAAEGRVKSVRFRASVAAQRVLSPLQRESAHQLARTTPGRSTGSSTVDARIALKTKLDRLRALANEVFPDGPPADYRPRIEEIQNRIRGGETAMAERFLDRLIDDLETRRNATKGSAR